MRLRSSSFLKSPATTITHEKVSAYREIMDAFSQEHPLLAAVAQGINDAEGLNLMFFPETKGEALGTGLALIAGRTRPMTLKMLSRPKPSRVQLINGRKPINAEFANKVTPLKDYPKRFEIRLKPLPYGIGLGKCPLSAVI